MRSISLRSEPTGENYRGLVRAVATISSEFRFVTMDRWALPDPAAKRIADLNHLLISSDHVDEWPGTRLAPGWTAQVWCYPVDELTIHVLLQHSSGFQDWGGDFPQDLHFVRADGSTVLGSTSSEQDVWLDLADEEANALSVHPSVKALLDEVSEQ